MGRSNNWSASNSTGTTDMGIWAQEDPGVSSVPLEPQSDVKKSAYDQHKSYIGGAGLPTHKYPIYIDNLNSENNVPIVQECIHFTAVKQGGISLQKVADDDRALAKYENAQNNIANKGDANDLGNVVPGVFKDVTFGVKEVFDATNAAKAQNNAAQSDPNRTEQQKKDDSFFGEALTFIKGKHDLIRQPAKNLEHCFLYMPNSVQFSEGATWGAEALGAVGRATQQLIKSPGGDIGDIMKNFTGGMITKTAQIIGLAAGAAAGAAAGKAGTILGALASASVFDSVGGGLRAAGRFTQNPYEEQLFNGIEFRTFTFDFAFAPSNETEGMEVDKIINMFRFHSRPSFVGGILGEGLYSFPNEFNIEFLMNKNNAFVEHAFIPSIHNCVCTNVSTNYTPEGFWVALKDGRSVSYGLSLAFTETKKITQQDVYLGY